MDSCTYCINRYSFVPGRLIDIERLWAGKRPMDLFVGCEAVKWVVIALVIDNVKGDLPFSLIFSEEVAGGREGEGWGE